jgi:predicted DNA-binding transcriptional regulator AlpA
MNELIQTNNDPFLDERAAAGVLNLSRRTLQKYRVSGGGPRYAKFGKAVRYRLSELNAWAAARVKNSTSEYGASA